MVGSFACIKYLDNFVSVQKDSQTLDKHKELEQMYWSMKQVLQNVEMFF